MSVIAAIAKSMIAYPGSTRHDAAHLLKVWAYARSIGELEALDKRTQLTLEIAALTHDIACPLCRQKYGSAAAPLQEKEGESLVRALLEDFPLDAEVIDRVAFLVAHHHTLDAIDAPDYQILIEADYLVNADESCYSVDSICAFLDHHFKTQTGKKLLLSLYPEIHLSNQCPNGSSRND